MKLLRVQNIIINLDQVEVMRLDPEVAEVTMTSGRTYSFAGPKLMKKLAKLKKSWIARLLGR